MTVSSGLTSQVAVSKQSQWGTEVAPAASDGIYVNSLSANETIEHFKVNTTDQAFQSVGNTLQGDFSASGSMEQPLFWDDLRMITYCLGNGDNYTTPSEQTVGEGDYLHVIEPADDISGLFATISQNTAAGIKVIEGAKVSDFSIKGAVGDGHLKLSSNFTSHAVTWDSSVVQASNFDSLTYPAGNAEVDYIRFDQGAVRINDASGAALTSGDALSLVSDISVDFKRSLDTGLYTVDSGSRIVEPVTSGLPEITISLTFSYLTSANKAFLADIKSGAVKKLEIVFTGSQIGAGVNRSLSLKFPAVKIKENAAGDVSGPDKLPSAVTLDVLAPADATTDGMAFAAPFQLSASNTQAAKAVA